MYITHNKTQKKAPISKFPPRALTEREIEATIQDYAHCASLAKEAG